MKIEPKENLIDALVKVAEFKNVENSIVEASLKEALVSAARKYLGLNKRIDVEIDPDTSDIRVFLRVEVVEDFPDIDESTMTPEEIAKFDEGYILLQDALEISEDAQPGDELVVEAPVKAFGRQAIATAKQILNQKVKEAERNKIFELYRNKIGTLVSGTVHKADKGNILIMLGKTEAIMPMREQLRRERLKQGQPIQAVIADVTDTTKGAQVILSRANGRFLAELFKLEVPEIYEGTVEVKNISRDPGFRAKIAVHSRDERVDPVGACVGMKGNRVQAIVRELSNERIDIVHWSDDIQVYIRRSLSPANIVKMIEISGTRRVVVVVADEDLAQAIGRNGQNVRLASQLTGRDLNVFGESEWAARSDEEKQEVLQARSDDQPIVRGSSESGTGRDRFSELDALFNKTDDTETDVAELEP